MPRNGDAEILTEQQMKHLMAFLLDPESPVNKKEAFIIITGGGDLAGFFWLHRNFVFEDQNNEHESS